MLNYMKKKNYREIVIFDKIDRKLNWLKDSFLTPQKSLNILYHDRRITFSTSKIMSYG